LKAFFPENASFMDHVRQICSSAKQIPGFKSLLKEDQMILLKASIFEVLVIKLAGQEPQRVKKQTYFLLFEQYISFF